MRPGRRGEASTKASSGRETAGLRATVMSCRPSRTVFPCDAHFAGLTDVSSNHVRAEAVRWGAGGQCGPALEGLPPGTLGRPRAGVELGLVRSCSQGSGGSPRIDAGRGTGPRRVPAAQPRILAAGPWTGGRGFLERPRPAALDSRGVACYITDWSGPEAGQVLGPANEPRQRFSRGRAGPSSGGIDSRGRAC